MNIQHQTSDTGGRFYYEENGKELAGMYYIQNEGKHITIEHTEVDESLGGKGVGKLLLEKTIDFAREHGLRITPVCSYAKHVMDKNADKYEDVRA
ncbi:MAG: N-acetyltransferase [Bacteroidetes bacterium]|nr:N-acetyltransferase [Bacteroidota bacterium]